MWHSFSLQKYSILWNYTNYFIIINKKTTYTAKLLYFEQTMNT